MNSFSLALNVRGTHVMRDYDRECRALARNALDAKGATVRLDYPATNGQAEPDAALGAIARIVDR